MEDEIRSAVEYCKSFKFHPGDRLFGKHVPVLAKLAERYLDCKGWPAKARCGLHPGNDSLACNNCADGRIESETIDACRLAALKEQERLLEKIERPLLLAMGRAEILLKSSTIPNATEKFLISDLNKIHQLIKGNQ